MKLVTFNIRCENGFDTLNHWSNRREAVARWIAAEAPDVIGFQEMKPSQRAYLEGALGDYCFVGRCRDADFEDESCAVAFRRGRAELLASDTFWLSPTPDVPGSRYPGQSDCPRVCTSALLRCDGRLWRVYNTHLDHIGEEARRLGMEGLLARFMADRAREDVPALVCGDMNAAPDEAPIRAARAAGLQDLTRAMPYTFHDWGTRRLKIDYVFADDRVRPVSARTEPGDLGGGLFLSDHTPVVCELAL